MSDCPSCKFCTLIKFCFMNSYKFLIDKNVPSMTFTQSFNRAQVRFRNVCVCVSMFTTEQAEMLIATVWIQPNLLLHLQRWWSDCTLTTQTTDSFVVLPWGLGIRSADIGMVSCSGCQGQWLISRIHTHIHSPLSGCLSGSAAFPPSLMTFAMEGGGRSMPPIFFSRSLSQVSLSVQNNCSGYFLFHLKTSKWRMLSCCVVSTTCSYATPAAISFTLLS